MRAVGFAAVGCLLGVAVAVGVIFLFGLAINSFGVQLYDSEAGQQRNFNLALLFALCCAAVGAWLGYRRGRR